jgi:membrane-associated protein
LVWVLSLTAAGYFFGNFAWVKANLSKIIWALIVIPGVIAVFGAWRASRNKSTATPAA